MNEQAKDAHQVAVRFDSVTFSYDSQPVLRDASFHVHAGEFTALIGPNGAGKSTVLRLLLGLLKPDSGQVRLFGQSPQLARSKVGYVPQQAGFDPAFPIRVSEVVRQGRLDGSGRRYGQADREAVRQALELVEIADLADRPYGALSGGQRRRVLVARALASRPALLVLDEPTANMDVRSEQRLFKTLGGIKGSTTILIVTHDTGFVSGLTDTVYCVGEHGRAGSVIRHEASPAVDQSVAHFGERVLQVHHDTLVPDTCCCNDSHSREVPS